MTSVSFGDGFAEVALLPQHLPRSPGTEPSALEVRGGQMGRPEQCGQSRCTLSKHETRGLGCKIRVPDVGSESWDPRPELSDRVWMNPVRDSGSGPRPGASRPLDPSPRRPPPRPTPRASRRRQRRRRPEPQAESRRLSDSDPDSAPHLGRLVDGEEDGASRHVRGEAAGDAGVEPRELPQPRRGPPGSARATAVGPDPGGGPGGAPEQVRGRPAAAGLEARLDGVEGVEGEVDRGARCRAGEHAAEERAAAVHGGAAPARELN